MSTSGNGGDEALLADQVRYYEDRAPIYEQLWLRQGPYSLGTEGDARWFEETARVERALAELDISGDVLELACGSGLWTRWLVPRAARLVAVDSSPSMLALNRTRFGDGHVEYVEADVFSWTTGGERFDRIVIGFFLSHVPPSRWDELWARLDSWLTPVGSVWFVDDAWGPDRPRQGEAIAGSEYAHRRNLGDRDYEIVKRFWQPTDLSEDLRRLGWHASIESGDHLLFGTAAPSGRVTA